MSKAVRGGFSSSSCFAVVAVLGSTLATSCGGNDSESDGTGTGGSSASGGSGASSETGDAGATGGPEATGGSSASGGSSAGSAGATGSAGRRSSSGGSAGSAGATGSAGRRSSSGGSAGSAGTGGAAGNNGGKAGAAILTAGASSVAGSAGTGVIADAGGAGGAMGASGAAGADPGDAVVIGRDWTTIPAGSFWMGTPDGDCPADYPQPGTSCTAELGHLDNEVLHYVTLTHPFEIMRKEAPSSLYRELMGWKPWWFGPCVDCGVPSADPAFFDICVAECGATASWYDAVALANEMSKDDGLEPCYILHNVHCSGDVVAGIDVGDAYMDCFNGEQQSISSATLELNGVSTPYECEGYRLPTEAEWEYAARAGSITAFHPSAGNDGSITQTGMSPADPNLTQIAWYSANTNGDAEMPGRKDQNAWGLYDMSGNNVEWVWGTAAEGPYQPGDMTTPVVDSASSAAVMFAGGTALRGGRYDTPAAMCRSGARGNAAHPGDNYGYGFRLVRTVF